MGKFVNFFRLAQRLLLVGILSLIASCSGGGGSSGASSDTSPRVAQLSWDAINAGNLSGYRVYFGTSPGRYFQSLGQGIDAGTNTSFTVSGLSAGSRYYFVVTGYDRVNNFESGYSNEVSKDIP